MVRINRVVAAACAIAVAAAGSACGASAPSGSDAKIQVVSTINAWGSIAGQLGGDKIQEISIITDPNTDPHSYEPSTADARAIAGARVVIENGVGYDSWIDKLLAANLSSGRTVLNVGALVHTPEDGNPHRWYSPADVASVIDAITADYTDADPADAGYFEQRRHDYLTTGLAQYHSLIADVKSKYAGTAIGASESIVSPLAEALGLDVLTPKSFLKAISEGTDPSPADKSTIDTLITTKAIRIYVFNSQNSTPDVQAQVDAATAAGIPISTVTETLAPAGATFQDWQSGQLRALAAALHRATGR